MNTVRNTLFLIATSLCLVGLTFSVATAEEPAGNGRKGKYAYRGIFKDCFKRGEVDSKKPTLNPDSKTRAQWIRLFKKGSFEEFGCSDEWAAAEDETKANILRYLWDHAADSPTPAKCK
jgi:hypothetical protein